MIRFGCDNSSTCYCVNRGSSRDEATMQLLRRLARAQVKHRILIIGIHVGRSFNEFADILTRFVSFSELQKSANEHGAMVLRESLRRANYCIDPEWAHEEFVLDLLSL